MSGFGDKKFSFGKPQSTAGGGFGSTKSTAVGFGSTNDETSTATATAGTKSFGFKKGGFSSAKNSGGGGFGAAKVHTDPVPTAEAPQQQPTIVIHDIGNVTGITEKLAAHSSAVSLTLTNKTNLTTMPIIRNLPPCVQKVELDGSCACIVEFERTKKQLTNRYSIPGFLHASEGLREVDLSVMTNLKHFGDNFLANCANLQVVTFPAPPPESTTREVSIGSYFLCESPKLKHVDLLYFSNLQVISPGFMMMNSSLVELIFPAMPRLHTIGRDFLFECCQLKRVVFGATSSPSEHTSSSSPDDKTVACSIGECFLETCTRLEELDLKPLFPNGSSLSTKCNFCRQCRSLRTVSLPALPTTVDSYFMFECSALTTISLEFFRGNGQTTLPDCFLADCTSLMTLDLSPLQDIATIGDLVFSQCKCLEKLDMSSMETLKTIGFRFAQSCEAVQSIVFSPRARFAVGTQFLYHCRSLHSIDLCCLSSMPTVPQDFLCGCTSIETLDLTPLAGVTAVAPGFLNAQTSLRSIHLPFTSAFPTINNFFLAGCSSLEKVTISPELHAAQSVTSVGCGFFARCDSLRSIDLHFVGNATSIGTDFLRGCKAMASLDTTLLRNVEAIDNAFLHECDSLEEVDVGFLTKITAIPSHFLCKCSALRRIRNLDVALSGVKVVGGHFLRMCPLEAVDLSCLDEVETIEKYCLAQCPDLKSVVMPPRLLKLTSIGSHFLFGNKALTELSLPSVAPPHSLSVGEEFLSQCTALTSVDLRFLENAQFGELLTGCSPLTLNAILIVGVGAKSSFRTKSRVLLHLPDALQRNAIECEASRDDSPAAVPQLQWSWKHHTRHPKGVQLAVLWIFSGLQHQHQTTEGVCESRALPGEVAFEICRYIGSPATELLATPLEPEATPSRTGGFSFGKTDGFAAKNATLNKGKANRSRLSRK